MDYIAVHSKFIAYFQNTTPEERLLKRNKNDFRITEGLKLYTESHHITPRSLGGLDVEENLVRLLPEEHIFIHMLRYKAFDTRQDMLAVRFCLNGCASPSVRKPKHIGRLTKRLRTGYSFIKTNAYRFRKEHGWQTKAGAQSISDKAKETMSVKCAKTGEPVGFRVSTKDPRVLSGEWVHHSSGMVSVLEIASGKTVRITTQERKLNPHLYKGLLNQAGTSNVRYSGLTDEDILEHAVTVSLKLGRIAPYAQVIKYGVENNIPIPKSLSKMRFNGNQSKEYLERLQKLLPDLEYTPYFKTEEQRRAASVKSTEYARKQKLKEQSFATNK